MQADVPAPVPSPDVSAGEAGRATRVAAVRITLDRAATLPLHAQIAGAIEAAIDDGSLAPGDRLETETALAARLGVGLGTTRRALADLVSGGRLVRRPALGTRVAPASFRKPDDLSALYGDDAHHEDGTEVALVELVRVTAPREVAEALGLRPGAPVALCRRLRLKDGCPVALLVSYLPEALAPSRAELERDGLHQCLGARGAAPRAVTQRIGARPATPAEAEILAAGPAVTVATLDRISFDEGGTPVEYGRDVCRASLFSVEGRVYAA